jgi:molecular chaperone HscC
LHFGIDLGTTNSLIAVFRDGKPELIPNALGQVLTPSVVAIRDGQLVVGEAARGIAISDPVNAASLFKRAMGTDRDYRLGGKPYRAPELSAMVLASLKADAEAALGVTVSDVVISVPAYFNELQRKAVRAAGRIAGLNVTRLINEPTAAALSYGLHERDGETRILIFDLGGGTFDISVLELFEGVMEVRASAGDAFLGGEDFTEALARHIAQTAALDPHDTALRPALLSLAEQAKRQLATAPEVALKAEINGKPINQTLTRERFEDITAQLLARLGTPLDRALSDAKLSPDQIDRLILVGGATRMPPVRAFAGRRLRQLPVSGVDPDQAVALGAAIQAALVARDAGLDDVVMTDVSAFTLGVDTVHHLGTGWKSGYFAPLIERNTVIPASREETFSTVEKGQTSVHFRIYQGESPLVSGNLFLGELSLPVPKNHEAHETVTVRFTYDVSGLLEVDVTANSTGKKANLVISKLAGEMSDAEIAEALKKLKSLKIHPRAEAENLHLKSRLEAAYAQSRGEARDWVARLLVSFDAAIEAQDKLAIAKLRAELHETLDRFEGDHVR